MLNDIQKELIEYGKISGSKGYTPGISGNMSCRFDDGIVITASGSANGYLSENYFSVVDMDGKLVGGNTKPSSERFLHLEFYKQRPDVNCVLHFHSPYLTAFASANVDLNDAVSPEIVYCFGKIPLAHYSIPGSEELVEKTSKFFKEYDVILMANHGVIVGGRNIKETYLKLELVEEYAKTILFTKLLGGAKILPEGEVEKIYSLRKQ